MRFAIALTLVPLLALAACDKGAAGGNSATATAPVAGQAPPAGKQWSEVVAPTPEGGMRMGNPDAPVKLIEYGSRSCPHCAKFAREGVPALIAGPIASGKLSYEFRDFVVHGPVDIGAILLGSCVEPAAFFPMLDQMMASQDSLLSKASAITPQENAALQAQTPAQVAQFYAERLGYIDFVKQRGVPDAKARACLTDQAALDRLAKNLQAADQQYQVSGTPTFILNGTKLGTDVAEWEQLKPVLAAAGVQ